MSKTQRTPGDTGQSAPAIFGELYSSMLLRWKMRNKNHELKGLNPGYKNGGGKTDFIQQLTNRTPQQRGMSRRRPAAVWEEKMPHGFWDLPLQAQRDTELSLIYVECDFMVDLRDDFIKEIVEGASWCGAPLWGLQSAGWTLCFHVVAYTPLLLLSRLVVKVLKSITMFLKSALIGHQMLFYQFNVISDTLLKNVHSSKAIKHCQFCFIFYTIYSEAILHRPFS